MTQLSEGQTWKAAIRAAAVKQAAHKARRAAHPEDAFLEDWDAALREDAERGEARRAFEAEQRAAMAAHLRSCGVEEGEVAALQRGLDTAWEAVRQAREWWRSDASLLLLYGPTGTGKTLAGAERVAACRFEYVRSDLGRVWEWPRVPSQQGLFVLAGRVAASSYYGEEADALRARLLGCRLLVLDELGTEVMSSPWLSALDTVINQRHRARRKTLLLSNLTGAAFKERYGDRIARRIREDGQAVSLGEKTLSGKTGAA